MASELRSSTWMGLSMKHVSLLTLTFQNSALILVMHYSRVMPLVGGRRYLTSTAVFLNEVIKLTLALTMALYDISTKLSPSAPVTTLLQTLGSSVFSGDSWKLAIPAMLYILQNSLQYVAVSNLDAATFQITYQIKILTTAVFSVVLLGRKLSVRQWLALLMLTVGVAVVQIPLSSDATGIAALKSSSKASIWIRSLINGATNAGGSVSGAVQKRSATYQGIEEDSALMDPQMNAAIGMPAVIVACFLSGLASVYFEKVLKSPIANANFKPYEASLWIRSVQLSFYSLFPALFIGVFFIDGEEIAKNGFFSGYNWVVWMSIALHAFGGICTALVVNYADNIVKNFATSISILISLFLSIIFLNLPISFVYLLGTALVLFATYLYGSKSTAVLPAVILADYEKTTVDREPAYYADLESSRIAKSPLLREGISTSRPGTPKSERHHYRVLSGRRSQAKRDE